MFIHVQITYRTICIHFNSHIDGMTKLSDVVELKYELHSYHVLFSYYLCIMTLVSKTENLYEILNESMPYCEVNLHLPF